MVMFKSAVLLLVFSSAAFAEIVTTTDGRNVELRPDGTYSILEQTGRTSAIPMKEEKPFFEAFAGEYGQNSIRFMPVFLNETGKTVVGFKFETVFKTAFGDEVFSFSGESSEKILSGKPSTAETFYFFEDNQFIADQPYDKLKIFEASGTGTISTRITAVAFDDGTVMNAGP